MYLGRMCERDWYCWYEGDRRGWGKVELDMLPIPDMNDSLSIEKGDIKVCLLPYAMILATT